ncbi:transposase, partial [Shigella dysenteriae]
STLKSPSYTKSVSWQHYQGRESSPFLLHIIFSSHLYTKAINDIVVIVSTFFIIKSY